jgi:hypothetical protein
MDIPEMATEHKMAFEPHREAEQEEQPEEDEECITLRCSDKGHTVPDQGRTISVCKFLEGRSSGQTRGLGDIPSHHGQTADQTKFRYSQLNEPKLV